jgi:hypothetical protein
MKDEEMPKGIQGLLQLKSEIEPLKKSKAQEQLVKGKCDEHPVNNEFEPIPSLTRYDGDGYKSMKLPVNNEFELIPSVTKYNGDSYKSMKLPVNNEFEPIPSMTKYNE